MRKPTAQQSITSAQVVAYSISDDVEIQLRQILFGILKRYGCTDLMAPIYTSIKELVINAIKANFKNIYFEDYAPKNSSNDIIKYEKALELFKHEISRENSNYFEKLARREDIKAVIDLWTDEKILHVKVANPVTMTDTELHNVNKKLVDAENCKDLADYCIKNLDDPYREGAGLGLILIMMMLKSLQAPKDSLVITAEPRRTTAYLKIPLVNDHS
ncbi:MAG TPA: hypothetical protein PKN50_16115 [Spirochaetota bacterium]|nr:hypothetical protein [Spirochaetota bacterium]HPV41875.1 hypothetical protein [Spirochaetota bacterium]